MQTGRGHLLDTNIVIDFFRGDLKVVDRITTLNIAIPSVVVGELLYGASLAKKKNIRIQQVVEFISRVRVLDVDQITGRFYAEIKSDLKQKGTPIPENDIWIAALSKQHSLILITRDSHFKQVISAEVDFW